MAGELDGDHFEVDPQTIIKRHGLEESEKAMERLLAMTSEMIESGVIPNSPEGIGKAWEIIFNGHPEIKCHFDKFASVFCKGISMGAAEGEQTR